VLYFSAKESNTMKSKNHSVATKSAKVSPTLLSRARRGSVVSVPGNGQGEVVLMRRDRWDRVTRDLKTLRARVADLSLLIETYEITNDPQMMDKIRRSMKDVAADRGVTIQKAKTALGLQ
jgi:PHD/YefM family antitoxin component YafN of YafNO toxin-antitoxin module